MSISVEQNIINILLTDIIIFSFSSVSTLIRFSTFVPPLQLSTKAPFCACD